MNWLSIGMIAVIVLIFFLMYRSQKKQERETNEMRNSLEVGDEITTIGGIIGEIVSIKEETVTIETGKDRTKIRVLRTAIRNVDVYAAEKNGTAKKNAEPEVSKTDKAVPNKKKKKSQPNNQPTEVEAIDAVTVEETANSDDTSKDIILNGEKTEK